jgi:hypothetical protein
MLGEYRRGDLGEDGKPIKAGPELVDLETYQRLQAILSGNAGAGRVGVRKDASVLSGLVKCGECGATLAYDRKVTKGKEYRYVRPKRHCPHPVMMRAEFLEQVAETVLLAEYGDKEIEKREWVAGEDTTAALADAVRRANALAERLGATASPTMNRVLQGQLDSITAEIESLEARPMVEGHWEMVGMGVTWAQKWEGAEKDERREMLREAGIEFHVTGGPGGAREVFIPGTD